MNPPNRSYLDREYSYLRHIMSCSDDNSFVESEYSDIYQELLKLILNKLIDKPEQDEVWKIILKASAKKGDLKMAKFAVSMGANNFQDALQSAVDNYPGEK